MSPHAIADIDPIAALTLFRTFRNRLGEANILRVLAENARQRDDLDGAERYVLAEAARQHGRVEDGRRQMEAAAALYEALSLPNETAWCLKRLREWRHRDRHEIPTRPEFTDPHHACAGTQDRRARVGAAGACSGGQPRG